MKVTKRDNFRVVARLKTVRASVLDKNLDGWLVGGDGVDVTFRPRRAGDMIGMSIPEQWATKDPERYYLEECQELVHRLSQLPYIDTANVHWDEEHTCSFCGLRWEELDQDFIDQYPQDVEPGHRVGTPVCCGRAVDEWLNRVQE